MTKIVYRILKQPTNSGDKNRAEWVAKMMPGAEPTAFKLGISPEAIIAQAALETGWGKSAIGNNVFGIKAGKGWHGKTQDVSTWEDTNGPEPGGVVNVVDRFRDYDSVADSFADHFRFLEVNSRYRNAGVFAKAGDDAYFMALQRAGYATDPAYAAKLSSICRSVKSYTANMERVELGALPDGYEVKPDGNIVNPNPKQGKIVKDSQKGEAASWLNGVWSFAAPILAALQGMDWRVVAVIGGVSIVLVGLAIWKFRSVRNARMEMAKLGIV